MTQDAAVMLGRIRQYGADRREKEAIAQIARKAWRDSAVAFLKLDETHAAIGELICLANEAVDAGIDMSRFLADQSRHNIGFIMERNGTLNENQIMYVGILAGGTYGEFDLKMDSHLIIGSPRPKSHWREPINEDDPRIPDMLLKTAAKELHAFKRTVYEHLDSVCPPADDSPDRA